MDIQHPYLLFLGDAKDQLAAKTAQGIAHWRPEWCLGQRRLEGCIDRAERSALQSVARTLESAATSDRSAAFRPFPSLPEPPALIAAEDIPALPEPPDFDDIHHFAKDT